MAVTSAGMDQRVHIILRTHSRGAVRWRHMLRGIRDFGCWVESSQLDINPDESVNPQANPRNIKATLEREDESIIEDLYG